jgi:type IV pilus assembly protein PilX
MMKRETRRGPSLQRGMVLVTSLLLLIVVTLLAVSMFRSFGLDEKIAGNGREKQRALNAAETAEQYAEFWLANGNASTGITCASPLVLSSVGQVCSNPLPNIVPNGDVTKVPWTVGGAPVGVRYVYAPSALTTMNISQSGGLGANNLGTYYTAPAFYISYLGTSPNGALYLIDAVGYGGSPDTAAVVEATFAISSSTSCKSCGQ